MDSDLNRGEYKAMEDIWAESIKLGKNVSGTIELKYSGNHIDLMYWMYGMI